MHKLVPLVWRGSVVCRQRALAPACRHFVNNNWEDASATDAAAASTSGPSAATPPETTIPAEPEGYKLQNAMSDEILEILQRSRSGARKVDLLLPEYKFDNLIGVKEMLIELGRNGPTNDALLNRIEQVASSERASVILLNGLVVPMIRLLTYKTRAFHAVLEGIRKRFDEIACNARELLRLANGCATAPAHVGSNEDLLRRVLCSALRLAVEQKDDLALEDIADLLRDIPRSRMKDPARIVSMLADRFLEIIKKNVDVNVFTLSVITQMFGELRWRKNPDVFVTLAELQCTSLPLLSLADIGRFVVGIRNTAGSTRELLDMMENRVLELLSPEAMAARSQEFIRSDEVSMLCHGFSIRGSPIEGTLEPTVDAPRSKWSSTRGALTGADAAANAAAAADDRAVLDATKATAKALSVLSQKRLRVLPPVGARMVAVFAERKFAALAISQGNTTDLCRIVHAFSVLGTKKDLLAINAVALKRLRTQRKGVWRYEAPELARLLDALVSSKATPADANCNRLTPDQAEAIQLLESQIRVQLPRFRFYSLTLLLHVYSRAPHAPPDLIRLIVHHLRPKVHVLTVYALSMSLHSLSELRYFDPDYFRAAAASLSRRCCEVLGSSVLPAMVAFRRAESPDFDLVMRTIACRLGEIIERLNIREIVMAMMAVSMRGLDVPEFFEKVAASLMGRYRPDRDNLSPRVIATLVHSFAKIPDSSTFNCGLLFDHLKMAAMPKLHLFTPQNLASLAWGLARKNTEADDVVQYAIERIAYYTKPNQDTLSESKMLTLVLWAHATIGGAHVTPALTQLYERFTTLPVESKAVTDSVLMLWTAAVSNVTLSGDSLRTLWNDVQKAYSDGYSFDATELRQLHIAYLAWNLRNGMMNNTGGEEATKRSLQNVCPNVSNELLQALHDSIGTGLNLSVKKEQEEMSNIAEGNLRDEDDLIECEYVCPATGFCIDIALLGRRIALEYYGNQHYVGENPDCQPNARALLRQELLRAHGWTTVMVPFFEWGQLQTDVAKIEYLKNALKRASDPAPSEPSDSAPPAVTSSS